MRDLSHLYEGWEVFSYQNEDIEVEGKFFTSYQDDVDAIYREDKRQRGTGYVEKRIKEQEANRRGKTKYTMKELGNHNYFTFKPRPARNELGEISP